MKTYKKIFDRCNNDVLVHSLTSVPEYKHLRNNLKQEKSHCNMTNLSNKYLKNKNNLGNRSIMCYNNK